MKIRDKYGYPVTVIIGKPITNIIRYMLHTSIKMTFKRRKQMRESPRYLNNI